MPVRNTANSTLIWVKELSTNIFVKTGKKLMEFSFIRQHRKSILAISAYLILTTGLSVFVYTNTVREQKSTYYRNGVTIVNTLASQSSNRLLENDVLALRISLNDLKKNKGLLFAAILDYENKIMAHTISGMANKPFDGLIRSHTLKTVDDATIEIGGFQTEDRVAGFRADITYGGVKLGEAYIALSQKTLINALSQDAIMLAAVLSINLLLVVAFVFARQRIQMARRAKIIKDLEDKKRIGPYVLMKKIGQGGMAELYKADYQKEDGFHRIVAIKKVLSHLSENSDFIKMFIREARLAAQLQHPNVVQILDFGKIMSTYFIAMEYIRGKNLAEVLTKNQGGLAVNQTIFIISQICKGLYFSHTKIDERTREPLNIIHRDISPQNILISYQGEVKISDFGISKASSEPSLTQAGVIKGKLTYMSPEQAMGKPINHQTDIYALGIIFYELLSGERLYKFKSDIEALQTIPSLEIPPINRLRADVNTQLNAIVMKCLAKDQQTRYQTAMELHDDLIQFKQDTHITYDGSNLGSYMLDQFADDEVAEADTDEERTIA